MKTTIFFHFKWSLQGLFPGTWRVTWEVFKIFWALLAGRFLISLFAIFCHILPYFVKYGICFQMVFWSKMVKSFIISGKPSGLLLRYYFSKDIISSHYNLHNRINGDITKICQESPKFLIIKMGKYILDGAPSVKNEKGIRMERRTWCDRISHHEYLMVKKNIKMTFLHRVHVKIMQKYQQHFVALYVILQ